MKKVNLLIVFLFLIFSSAPAQTPEEVPADPETPFLKNKTAFFQFDLALPFSVDGDDDDEASDYNDENCTDLEDLIPNGLGAKIGFGIQKDKWVAVSLHTGIDWKANDKLVAVPLYGNFRLSPDIGDNFRISLQAGYGRGFTLGRGNLVGYYRRYAIGLEPSKEGSLNISIEYYRYSFYLHNQTSVGNFSLGFQFRWN